MLEESEYGRLKGLRLAKQVRLPSCLLFYALFYISGFPLVFTIRQRLRSWEAETESGGLLTPKFLYMVIFQVIGNSYICTTLDAETASKKAEMLLTKVIRNKAEREQRAFEILRWCQKAKPGSYLKQDEEFTITVSEKRKR